MRERRQIRSRPAGEQSAQRRGPTETNDEGSGVGIALPKTRPASKAGAAGAAAEVELELEIQNAAGQAGILGAEIEHVVAEVRQQGGVAVERFGRRGRPFANDFERDGIAARQAGAGDRRIQPADEQILRAQLRGVQGERQLALIVECRGQRRWCRRRSDIARPCTPAVDWNAD